jgi:hypothetical protein
MKLAQKVFAARRIACSSGLDLQTEKFTAQMDSDGRKQERHPKPDAVALKCF